MATMATKLEVMSNPIDVDGQASNGLWLSLATPVSSDVPIATRLQWIEELASDGVNNRELITQILKNRGVTVG